MARDHTGSQHPEGVAPGVTSLQRLLWYAVRVGWVVLTLVLIGVLTGQVEGRTAATVLRPVAVYFGLLILLRVTGKRSLGEITTFDFILVLIISEAVSPALTAGDETVLTGLIVVATLVVLDVGLSLAKRRLPALDRLLEDEPVILVRDGKVFHDRLKWERVDESDILEAARQDHGIERMGDIRYAILERRGAISVVPRNGRAQAG